MLCTRCLSAKHEDLLKCNNHKNPRCLLYLKQLNGLSTALMFGVNCNPWTTIIICLKNHKIHLSFIASHECFLLSLAQLHLLPFHSGHTFMFRQGSWDIRSLFMKGHQARPAVSPRQRRIGHLGWRHPLMSSNIYADWGHFLTEVIFVHNSLKEQKFCTNKIKKFQCSKHKSLYWEKQRKISTCRDKDRQRQLSLKQNKLRTNKFKLSIFFCLFHSLLSWFWFIGVCCNECFSATCKKNRFPSSVWCFNLNIGILIDKLNRVHTFFKSKIVTFDRWMPKQRKRTFWQTKWNDKYKIYRNKNSRQIVSIGWYSFQVQCNRFGLVTAKVMGNKLSVMTVQ